MFFQDIYSLLDKLSDEEIDNLNVDEFAQQILNAQHD